MRSLFCLLASILQSTYTDQIADLSVQKNKLSGDINAILDELTYLQEELSAAKLKHREAEGTRQFHLYFIHISFMHADEFILQASDDTLLSSAVMFLIVPPLLAPPCY
jgi:hypothetical protein